LIFDLCGVPEKPQQVVLSLGSLQAPQREAQAAVWVWAVVSQVPPAMAPVRLTLHPERAPI
jgi:hypothetical protein